MRSFFTLFITSVILTIGLTLVTAPDIVFGQEMIHACRGWVFYPSGATGVNAKESCVVSNAGNLSTTMVPILKGTADRYLFLRFYNSDNNQTVPHVSFFLNVTKGNQKLLYDLFHTHTGNMTIKLEKGPTIGNWIVKADREPITGGWINNTAQ